MKYCLKCKTEKPANEFYGNKIAKDGLSSSCRSCMRAYTKKKYHGEEELDFYHTYGKYPSWRELKQYMDWQNTSIAYVYKYK